MSSRFYNIYLLQRAFNFISRHCLIFYYGFFKKGFCIRALTSRNAKLPLPPQKWYHHATGISNVMVKYLTHKKWYFLIS